MVSKQAVIHNSAGIHIRPSSEIFKHINDYEGKVFLYAKNQEKQIKSMLEILIFALIYGDEVTIKVDGPNEVEFCNELVTLFEKHYDFK